VQLRTFTDDELVRHAHNSLDPLTSTELEQELVRRLDTAAAEVARLQGAVAALDSVTLEPADVPPLLKLRDEFSAADLKTLREKLERADKWYAIAEEAGDLFQRLQDLTNTTL
jgi:hypothetical protein